MFYKNEKTHTRKSKQEKEKNEGRTKAAIKTPKRHKTRKKHGRKWEWRSKGAQRANKKYRGEFFWRSENRTAQKAGCSLPGIFHYVQDHLFSFPSQIACILTLGDLVDKPWSQLYSPLSPLVHAFCYDRAQSFARR